MKHAGVVKIAQGKCIWCACALCPSVLDLVKPHRFLMFPQCLVDVSERALLFTLSLKRDCTLAVRNAMRRQLEQLACK